jgi:RND family efflux transporter MFP subunit
MNLFASSKHPKLTRMRGEKEQIAERSPCHEDILKALLRRCIMRPRQRDIWQCKRVPIAVAVSLLVILARALSVQGAEAQAVGIVEPFIDVTLSTPVAGIVTSRKFEEGAIVPAGAVLLELDNNLERLEVDRRRIVREQKEREFENLKKLYGTTKGVSKEELDTRESEYRVAAVEHDMALEQLRRRQVVAPHGGVITEILLEVGEACAAYQPLVQVVDTSRCYLVASVEASHGSRIKRDQNVRLEIDLGGGKAVIPGKVFFVSPLVDPASGLQKVKIIFDNKDGRVRPGLTGIVLSETQG